MKLILMILFLSLAALAQSTQTDDIKKLSEVEKQIAQTQTEIKETEKQRTWLLMKFTAESPNVKQVEADLVLLKKILVDLEFEKTELLSKIPKSELSKIDTLPNDNTELLKIIIRQNQRIIELLEKLTSSP